jgi:hypothetical protein
MPKRWVSLFPRSFSWRSGKNRYGQTEELHNYCIIQLIFRKSRRKLISMSNNQLFAWERYPESDVRAALEPIQACLWRSIMEPWQDLQQYRMNDPNFRHLPPGGMAQWLHYQIIARVRGFLPALEDTGEDEPGWFVDSSGMFHLSYRFMQLTFKKLSEDFQRSNACTIHNEEYWSQKVLPGMPLVIHLIVGYQWTDETATALGRIAIVCPSRRCPPRWWYEIPAPPEATARPTLAAPPPPGPPEVQDKGFRVKSKKKEDGKKEDGDKAAES